MSKPKFKMLGTTEYKGHKYSITENRGMVSPEKFGLYNFYGGRVKKLGILKQSKTEGIYLCIEGTEAIDIIQFLEEPEEVDVPERDEEEEDGDEEDTVGEPTVTQEATKEKPKARPANRSNAGSNLPRKNK